MHKTWHAGGAVSSLRRRARRGSAAQDTNPVSVENRVDTRLDGTRATPAYPRHHGQPHHLSSA